FILSLSFSFFLYDSSYAAFYALSLHDALPISGAGHRGHDVLLVLGHPHGRPGAGEQLRHEVEVVLRRARTRAQRGDAAPDRRRGDRKSTRLNSSHVKISYAVFCLKKEIS